MTDTLDDTQTLDEDEPGNAGLPWRILPPFGETNFDRISKLLQGLETRIVYIGVPDPDIGGRRRWWNLSGNYSGAEGLELGPGLGGLMHSPFELLLSQGPYELGAQYQRTNHKPKPVSMSVQVNGEMTDAQTTSFRYRMLEQRWWNSWSDEMDGWLGVFTRTHGWRFIKVRQASESKTAFEIDPASNGNNFMQWDMDIVGLFPYFSKQSYTNKWTNTAATSTPQDQIEDIIKAILDQFSLGVLFDKLIGQKQIGDGNISIKNAGTVATYPTYIVSSPGIAWIQSGNNADGTPRMVQLPNLTEQDGYCLVDTDPNNRTLTCATDPLDPLFYQILRNAEILEVILGSIINTTEPVWKRFTGSFDTGAQIPARTSQTVKVWHSNHDGTITAIMPQRFKMAWG